MVSVQSSLNCKSCFWFVQILRGRQNDKRQSELNLAMTLFSIVMIHILCNILRVFLGVLVVTSVGITHNTLHSSQMVSRLLNLQTQTIPTPIVPTFSKSWRNKLFNFLHSFENKGLIKRQHHKIWRSIRNLFSSGNLQ